MNRPFRKFLLPFLFLCFCLFADAQKLSVTGYMQPQWQLGEETADLHVGTDKENDVREMYNRVGIRRGRIKFFYDDGNLASGGFQFNVIDKPGLDGAQVQIKELYLNIKSPLNKASSFQAGVFNRPFSFEINYSTSELESPERARIITTLLPDECDLGGMLILTPSKGSPLDFITLQGGLFAGNGINPETDSRKDFIGQIVAEKPIGDMHVGLGFSYYNGGVYQTNRNVFTMGDGGFTFNNDVSNVGSYAKREYLGVDAQWYFNSLLGRTQLRGEYLWGTQPGNAFDSESPSRAALPSPEDTYIRPFSGGYVSLIHNIIHTPLSAVLKYEVYDPNTGVSGSDIGSLASFTGVADVMYTTLGAGFCWQMTPALKATLFYEMNRNETSLLLANNDYTKDYASDRKDNVLTVRVQYKF